MYSSTGIYVFENKILDYLPERGAIERTTFPRLSRVGKLRAFPYRGSFITVNSHSELKEAEEQLRK